MAKKKYIDTPQKMWELFLAYKKHTKDSPISKNLYGGKDFYKVVDKLEKPLTMVGFENYVADIPDMPMSLERYFANSNKDYEEFLTICSRIVRTIRQDQIEGGMVGIYNTSITQRLNGLKEQSETIIKEQPMFGEDD